MPDETRSKSSSLGQCSGSADLLMNKASVCFSPLPQQSLRCRACAAQPALLRVSWSSSGATEDVSCCPAVITILSKPVFVIWESYLAILGDEVFSKTARQGTIDACLFLPFLISPVVCSVIL